MTELTGLLYSSSSLPQRQPPDLTSANRLKSDSDTASHKLNSLDPTIKPEDDNRFTDRTGSRHQLATQIDPTYSKPTINLNILLEKAIDTLFADTAAVNTESLLFGDAESESYIDFGIEIETASGTIIKISSTPDGAISAEIFGEVQKEEYDTLNQLLTDLSAIKQQFLAGEEVSLSSLLEDGFSGIESFNISVAENNSLMTVDYTRKDQGFVLNTNIDGYKFEIAAYHTGAIVGGYENDLGEIREDILRSLRDYQEDIFFKPDAEKNRQFMAESLALAERIYDDLATDNNEEKLPESENSDDTNTAPIENIGETLSFVDFEIALETPREIFNQYNSGEISQAKISAKRETQVTFAEENIKLIRHLDEISVDIHQHKGIAGDSVEHANFGRPGESGGQTYQFRHQITSIVRETFEAYNNDYMYDKNRSEEKEELMFIKRVVDGFEVDEDLNRI